jgi:hypothetical protein
MRTHPISWRRSRLAGAYSQGFIFSRKLQEACSLFRFARELGPRSKVSRDGQIVFCHLRPGTSWISEAEWVCNAARLSANRSIVSNLASKYGER